MPGVAEVGSTANNYQILAKLATGGMAEIFLARGASAVGVERYVVLKRILRERANDSSFVQMFLEEARLAAQLNHPNVAQVHDIGKLGDSYFFTMEYVHGETVRAILHRARSLRRTIPLGVVLTVIAGTAAGLHHAHGRLGLDGQPLNIVHRDVSPSNLMVSYEGSVKVVDFGVAKAETSMHQTRSGSVKGKISYLSPEQCRSVPVDRRSDLFSLGIVLWEMLTTERLYRRASDFENMNAIVNEPPPRPSSRRMDLPPELDAMAERLLAKTGAERYQSGGELVEAIEDLAARHGIVLSASALSRFMRELFGQRPEPWHELELQGSPDGVTLTGESIPELSSGAGSLDHRLARVRDLSRQRDAVSGDISQSATQPSEAWQRPPSQLMTTPSMPAASPPAAPGTGSVASDGIASPARSKRAPWALILAFGGSTAIGVTILVGLAGPSSPGSDPVDAQPAVTIDAAVVAVDAVDADVPDVTHVAVDAAPPPPRPSRSALIAGAFEERRYGDAVEACSDGLRDRALECTLSACREKRTREARSWFARVPSANKPAVQAACKDAGIEVVRARTRPRTRPDAGGTQDDCLTNPMSCQH